MSRDNEIPFRVRTHRGNVYLIYDGVDPRGTVLSYERPVGAENPAPGTFYDALGVAVLKLLRLYEREKARADELQALLDAEPCDRPRKKKGA